jgi:hypothetical protein
MMQGGIAQRYLAVARGVLLLVTSVLKAWTVTR